MQFVGGVGSLTWEVWQAQIHKEFEHLRNYSTWWPNFYILTKCRIVNHLRICNQQQEGFHQWVANSCMGCTWEFF